LTVILIGFVLQDGGRPATIRAVITRAQDNGRRISRATVRNGLRDFEQSGLTESCSVQVFARLTLRSTCRWLAIG